MVISHILGGLGNQMFQYAAGKALSRTLSCPLLLDIHDFGCYELHNGFEIDRVFSAPVKVAKKSDVAQVLGWRSGKLMRRLLRRMQFPLLNGPNLVIEPHFNYWSGLKDVSSMTYLMGYWQSEKYFKDFELQIKSDFSFTSALSGGNLQVSRRIQSCNSVALHVRRGDYVTDRATAKILNLCSIQYYQEAIDRIARRIHRPIFYIFSDDQRWVRNNLKVSFPVEYIERNDGPQSYIDMQLMSLCKHQIIANSSFGWWGAWLNTNPDKIVIAPRNWFCNHFNDDDLIPQEWERL